MAQRSAAVQIVRPTTPTGPAENVPPSAKKGKFMTWPGKYERGLIVDGTQRLCRNVLIYGYVLALPY